VTARLRFRTTKVVPELLAPVGGDDEGLSGTSDTGVPQSSEQKRTLSRADCQVVTVIGVTQRPQFTMSDAVGQCERVTPQDVDVLVTQR
jgi:hypothetical protein